MAIEDYSDIIHLPYKGRMGGVSIIHLPYKGRTGGVSGGLSMYQRAAQFAPFAALTGHDAAIRETARLTDSQIALDDENNEILNRRLSVIRDHLKDTPAITVTFFQPDEKKAGGLYESYTGRIKDIDDYKQHLVMIDGKKIPLFSILDIDGKIFDNKEI